MASSDDLRKKVYTYGGIVHVHSQYSDGSGTISQILQAASRARLSYLVLTDHNTLAGANLEGWHDGVLLLAGMELNWDSNHYLALGARDIPPGGEDNSQLLIDGVRAAGGKGFLAHPLEMASPWVERGRSYPWLSWPVYNFDGFELWNYTSAWRGFSASFPRALFRYLFYRQAGPGGPPPALIRLWDCYTAAGYRLAVFGGCDAHANVYALGPLRYTLFPYEKIFKTITTYLQLPEKLPSSLGLARERVFEALARGQSFISLDSLHKGEGFLFYLRAPTQTHLPGSFLPYGKGLMLQVQSPATRSRIKLVGNGRTLALIDGPGFEYPVSAPGVYRAEVTLPSLLGKYQPWIYSNPIYVTEGGNA